MAATITDPGVAFNVSATVLKAALATLKDAVPSRGALPVLGTVRLCADGDDVTATTTDLDLSLTVRLYGAAVINTKPSRRVVNINFQMLVKLLADVKKASTATVVIRVDDGEATVSIGNSAATLRADLTSEWPKEPVFEPSGSHLIDMSQLTEVAVASGTDETKPLLCGVYLHNDLIDGVKSSAMVATDSYRLSAVRGLNPIVGLPARSVTTDGGLRIPLNAIRVLAKLKEPVVEMQWNCDHLRFVVGDVTVTARYNDGDFPQYKNLVPDKFEGGFWIDDPAGFAAGLKYLQRFGGFVKINGDIDGLVLTVVDPDNGTFTRNVAGSTSGLSDDAAIRFNMAFVQALIGDLTGPVLVNVNGLKPATIVTPHPAGGERLRLLMPIR